MYIFLLVLTSLLILPLAGIKLAEVNNISYYLQFPPRTGSVEHAAFNCYVFWGLAAFLFFILLLFTLRALTCSCPEHKYERGISLPWWGILGILTGILAWLLAWTRFPGLSHFQIYTFPVLWLSYILVMNSLSYTRTKKCLLLNRPFFLGTMFLSSVIFWWFFEYLNRFVQNWYYINTQLLTPWEYIVYASICFSTVLPAVLSTGEFFQTFSFFRKAYGNFIRIKPLRPKCLALLVLLISLGGLFGIGVYPNYLFPLLWISPLLIIVSLLSLLGKTHLFTPLSEGDWSRIVIMALAALFCGFFWEMWNFYSIRKWEYSIPFVHRYQIFEMPILGYTGYLPLGLECAVVGDLVSKLLPRERSTDPETEHPDADLRE